MFRLVLLLCLAGSPVFAQESELSVTVQDKESNAALEGVTVVLDNSNTSFTGPGGKTIIQTIEGKHVIQASYIGYEKYTDTINISTAKSDIIILLNTAGSTLDLVVVSASRYEKKINEETISMNVIKSAFIQNSASVTMDEALNKVPGVNIVDGQANIRGGSGYSYGAGSRVLVLVDDIPQISADAGDVKWDFLPVENIKQVEVLKGASSSLYGSSALNGVINIRTASPGPEPETEITLYQGVFENPKRKALVWWGNKQPYQTGGYFSHRRQVKQFDIVTGGNLFKERSFQQGVSTERARVNAGIKYRFKKVDGLAAGLNINYMYQNIVTFFIWQNDSTGGYRPYGGIDTAGSSLTKLKEHRFNIDPYIKWVMKDGITQSLKGRYYETRNITTNGQSSTGTLRYAEYQATGLFNFGLRVTSGLTASFTTVRSELYLNHDGDNQSAYIQLDQKIKKLSIVGGVRYEIYRVDTFHGRSNPVFRAGANYELFKGNNIRASIGQGYRFPSVAEKYVKTSLGAIYVFPNPALNAEKGWSAEAGIQQGFKISSWQGYVDVAAFTQYLTQFMEFTFGQWGDPVKDVNHGIGFKSINLNKAKINGIEATVYGQGKLFNCPVNLLAGVTFINPINIDEEKKSDSLLAALPVLNKRVHDSIYNLRYLKYRYNFTFKLEADISYKIFNVGVGCRYNSFMKNMDPFLEAIPGIYSYRRKHNKGNAVFDTRCSVLVRQKLKIALIVKNLLNTEYTDRPALLEAPRNYTLQLSVKF